MQLIAGWDFQTTNAGGTLIAASPNTPTLFSANVGSGTLFLNGSNSSSTWLPATELSAFTGTSTNASNGLTSVTTSPAALALLSSSANGKAAVFALSTAGLTNISITLAAQRTATGFTNQLWEVSPDGSTWSAIGDLAAGTTAGTITTSFAATGVISFSNVAGLANLSAARVRVTFTGATTTTGNNRIDNIQFVGEPLASGPTISASTNSISGLTATQGAPGVSTNFTASASNLSNNITVTAIDAVNFAISTNNSDFTNALTLLTNALGGLSNTPVYVRLTGTAQGVQSNSVSLVSGTVSNSVIVSGTVAAGGPPNIAVNPTNIGTLVAFTGQPGTAQSVAVTGQSLPGAINVACDSAEYEVANSASGTFGVAATLPAAGGTVLVRLRAGSTAGAVAAATMVLESGTGSAKVSATVPIAGGTRVSGTSGLEPGLQTFAGNLDFTATGRNIWGLKGNTVDGRGTNFSGVNVGVNLGVIPGAGLDIVLNGANSTTDFADSFWSASHSWLVFSVTGNTTGDFALGAITPDSGGKYYASYGSFGLRTDAGGDVYLDWTPAIAATPVVLVSPANLSLPGTTTNLAGNSTNFSVSGTSLSGNITVTANDAVNFAVSTNSSSGFAGSLVLAPSGGAVSSTPVYVRLTGANAGNFTNTIAASSTGATPRSVSVTGTVTNL
ncbi:MAG: hypothetical protein JHC85_08930, partial [Chthoniobacterales bacterium]|nr:hypothetical protein [Chthoniobacterales bacterium]